MQSLLLKGGRVIDPSRGFDQVADVLIQDGKIAALGPGLGTPDGAEVRDVRNKVVAPGLVDVHVHLREPGGDRSEEHTSELQSRLHLVCRLLLEKKKSVTTPTQTIPAPPSPRNNHQITP